MKRNKQTDPLQYSKIETPIGSLYLVTNQTSLVALLFENTWEDYKKTVGTLKAGESAILKKAEKQLIEYFAGGRKTFDLPFQLHGTEFQKEVWTALTKIPYGKTISYGDQAKSIGRPKAMRAVGGTNGMNPLSIIVPCHRVIGKSGKLTGYAGGLERKEFLLKLEGILP